jgi:hypothetical protein
MTALTVVLVNGHTDGGAKSQRPREAKPKQQQQQQQQQ